MGMERKGLGARGLRLNLCPAQKKIISKCIFMPVFARRCFKKWAFLDINLGT
jgi:hypothetical protein